MQGFKLTGVLAIAGVLCASCTITSEKPIFGPDDSVKLEGFQGAYRLYDPSKEMKREEDSLITFEKGELVPTDIEECRKGKQCSMNLVVVRLPSSENTYVIQIPLEKLGDQVMFAFVERIGDYGIACAEIDEDRHGRHLDRIRAIGTASGLEVESGTYHPVFITGNPEPERFMQFLDEIWKQVPLNVWSCLGLIPDGKPVEGIEEILNRTAYGEIKKN